MPLIVLLSLKGEKKSSEKDKAILTSYMYTLVLKNVKKFAEGETVRNKCVYCLSLINGGDRKGFDGYGPLPPSFSFVHRCLEHLQDTHK